MIKKMIICTFLPVFTFLQAFAQSSVNPDTVCAGSNVYYKIQNPTANSTFTWGIYNGEGSITSGAGTDSIRIAWNNTAGIDSIWVVETNQANCTGDTARLKVVRTAAPNAAFDNAAICYGETLNVNFTGYPPWQFEYTLNGNTLTLSNIVQNPYPLSDAGTYVLVQISDKYCNNSSPSGQLNAIIAAPLQELQIYHE